MANNVDPDQTAPIGAVCSGSTLFASIFNSSVIIGNHLQKKTSETTFSDAYFSCHFKGCNLLHLYHVLTRITEFVRRTLHIIFNDRWLLPG